MNALHLLGCLLGLAGTGVLLVGAICFAHHRGDARMGVADTQGHEDRGPMNLERRNDRNH